MSRAFFFIPSVFVRDWKNSQQKLSVFSKSFCLLHLYSKNRLKYKVLDSQLYYANNFVWLATSISRLKLCAWMFLTLMWKCGRIRQTKLEDANTQPWLQRILESEWKIRQTQKEIGKIKTDEENKLCSYYAVICCNLSQVLFLLPFSNSNETILNSDIRDTNRKWQFCRCLNKNLGLHRSLSSLHAISFWSWNIWTWQIRRNLPLNDRFPSCVKQKNEICLSLWQKA